MAKFLPNAIVDGDKTFHAVQGLVNGKEKTYKVTSKTFRTNIDGVKGPVVDFEVDPQAYADAMIEQYNYQATKSVESPAYETFEGPVSGKIRKLVPAFGTEVDGKKVKVELAKMDPEEYKKALDEHYMAIAEKAKATEQALTPEQKAERSEKGRAAFEARMASLTPEEIEAYQAQVEANAEKQRAEYAALPQEVKDARSAQAKAHYEAQMAQLTPEEREALHAEQVARGKAAYEAQDKDAFAAAVEVNREAQKAARANMTPEELEAERARGLAAAEALDLSGIELPEVEGPTL